MTKQITLKDSWGDIAMAMSMKHIKLIDLYAWKKESEALNRANPPHTYKRAVEKYSQ